MFCVYTPIDDMNILQIYNYKNFNRQIAVAKKVPMTSAWEEGSSLVRIRMPRSFGKGVENTEGVLKFCDENNIMDDKVGQILQQVA